MAYTTSNNLKNTLKLKNSIYKLMPELIPEEEDTNGVDSWFCGECRNIFSTQKASTIVCPHCGHKGQTSQIGFCFDIYEMGQYHIENIIDSVTINKSFNDNGDIKDINITILYHPYRISCDMQTQISWQYYKRVLFNIETKQVYYTSKQLLSKKVDFSHFLLHKEIATHASEFAPMIQLVIKEIYNTYGIKQNKGAKSWCNATPKNMLSPKVAFMCLKFPVMMNFAYDLFISYKRRASYYGVVDMHFSIIYWACNYDRVLKAALTSTTEQEYIERTDNILCKLTNDKTLISSVRGNPLYVVYARYMYHLGFRNFESVERIVNLVSQPDAHKLKIGLFVLDILCKRMHTRNKMYRRLLKLYTEDRILDIICNAKTTCTYKQFFNWSYDKRCIDDFYKTVEPKLDCGYSTQELFDDFVGLCDSLY